MPFTTTPPSRPSIVVPGTSSLSIAPATHEAFKFTDSRNHGYQGPTRSVTLPRASTSGGTFAKSQDGMRCVVAGRESLRILRISEGSSNANPEHRYVVGRGGQRIDASRNLWAGSGLKVDSSSTDVAWGHKTYDNKIITSARNGELIVWDLNKSGPSKFERRVKDHTRAINKIAYSPVLMHYLISGSADGLMRVWDLRDMSKSVLWIHHPTAIRSVICSPCSSNSLHVVSGLDNGTIHRWDLRSGQKGQLDRMPVAHTGPILAFDWTNPNGIIGGWLASAGLDRCVKVWDLRSNDGAPSGAANTGNPNLSHIPQKPMYTLHTSFPVRRVAWRPGYETELAIASNNEFGYPVSSAPTAAAVAAITSPGDMSGLLANLNIRQGNNTAMATNLQTVGSADSGSVSSKGSDSSTVAVGPMKGPGDLIEIWDVRRPWIAKWSVDGSCVEGGVTDMTFADSHAIWTLHPSGAFSQMDLRHSSKPIDSVPRVGITWNAAGTMTFVTDNKALWELPYDDTEKSVAALETKAYEKKIGDPVFIPTTQTLGSCAIGQEASQLQGFAMMAASYRIEGTDRRNLCEINAKVAFDAGQYEAGQTWLLLQSLLTDLLPPRPPYPTVPNAPHIVHSLSAPAAVSKLRTPPREAPQRSSSSEPAVPTRAAASVDGNHKDASAGMPPSARVPSSTRDRSSTRTPSSTRAPSVFQRSTPSSPLSPSFQGISSPRTPAPRSRSRRQPSITVLPSGKVHHPSMTRSSLSAPSIHSESPSDSNKSHSNLRHVGEGALDDSDSSEEKSSDSARRGEEPAMMSNEALSPLSHSSPLLDPVGSRHSPSPLSKEDRDWAEDERDEDSVSPASSETESNGSVESNRASRSSPVNRGTRSPSPSRIVRNSPISLSVSVSRHPIHKQESHSSIRTVIAGDTGSIHDSPTTEPGNSESSGLKADKPQGKTSPSQVHHRRPSQTFANGTPSKSSPDEESEVADEDDFDEARFLRGCEADIRLAESKYRDVGWSSFREGLEYFADAGDVQLCAMLSCIAREELQISHSRASRFIEAYLEILTRLKLDSAAAYLRKYVDTPDIRQSTKTQTSILTSCPKCRKAVLPQSSDSDMVARRLRGGYNYCQTCKQSVMRCSIW
ncbi:hypothetical protein BD410DRAFT_45075 [Rickenella mellea]|uniref:Uncharacterized protein n=1 Tax=Rickenella mellea TaxID=50990 RepID=A0A4R5XHV5_9AGAM|nr:hypothetical protein BD410DRAFT_45075 [Rickenella mellea]